MSRAHNLQIKGRRADIELHSLTRANASFAESATETIVESHARLSALLLTQ